MYQDLYEKEVKLNTSLNVDLEKLNTMLANLKVDHDDLFKKFYEGISDPLTLLFTNFSLLLIANRSRNDLEIQFKDENQVTIDLKKDISGRDKFINELRLQIEQNEFKLNSIEREIDNKEIRLKAQEVRLFNVSEKLIETTSNKNEPNK